MPEQYAVLMPVHGGADPAHLSLAIESMLCQTVKPAQFVIVCDGPLTPPLDAVIAAFCQEYGEGFQIVHLPAHPGLAHALQTGLLCCTHELVARMDADDIALPDRMEKQLAEMDHRPEVSVLGGQIAEFASDPDAVTGFRRVPLDCGQIRRFAKSRNPMNHMTVLLRRSHILAVGGYEEMEGYEDYYLWARLLTGGYQLRNIGDICCRVRTGDGMYRRRGGLAYFRSGMKLQRYLLKSGLIRPMRFAANSAARFLGAMVPPSLRRLCYHTLLRHHGEK